KMSSTVYTIENLTPEKVAGFIDHALLRPDMTEAEVIEGCKLCATYKAFSVCVKPCDVKLAAETLKNSVVSVGTVISFPHGNSTPSVKVAEALQAIEDGAVELDMVLNIGALKSGRYEYVQNEIHSVVSKAKEKRPGTIVKVIFECSLLSKAEIKKACELSTAAGADFVKTSTGFSTGGALIPDLILMRTSCPSQVQVKASGGIRNLDYMIECLNVGCTRIGCSGTKAIVEELLQRKKDPSFKPQPSNTAESTSASSNY
ncbi:hypothetical protein BB560_005740, partial [Smittium megazygosporum]